MPRGSAVSAKAWSMICLSQAMAGFFYIDRQNLAVLKHTLAGTWAMTEQQYAALVTIFMVAYAANYLVSGWIIDRIGVRRAFPLFVGLMSLATCGSGLAQNWQQLAVCRFALGAAEAGVMPASVVALAKWISNDRRASVQGITKPILLLAQLGATTLPVVLTGSLSWRAAFVVPGLAGGVFAFCWFWKDTPDLMETVLERTHISKQWFALLSRRPVVTLIAARALSDPVWFFLAHWQAGFLQEKMHFSLHQIATMGWIPTAAKLGVGIALGLAVDRRIQAGHDPAATRIRYLKGIAWFAPLFCAMAWVDTTAVTIALLSLIQIVASAWLTISTVLMVDLTEQGSPGTSVALMNGAGVVTSSVFTSFAGSLISDVGYVPIFVGCGLVFPVAALVLNGVAISRPRAPGRVEAIAT